jgi:hypothetical protein
MTTSRREGLAVLAEVVAVLARYPSLRVMPQLDREKGVVSLTVRAYEDGEHALDVLALHDELRYLMDVATVRAIATSYAISAERLSELIPMMKDDAQPRHLTVGEIDSVIQVLTDGPEFAPARLVASAIPKLIELGRALAGSV